MNPLTIHLDVFQGPLDLLLQLIEKNQIDIYDIPIAQLTDQYIEAIKAFPRDMESMSAFLLMAATLLEIKSKMLLPRPVAPLEEADPREALAARLAEYKRIKAVTDILREKNNAASVRFFKEPDQNLMDLFPDHTDIDEILEGVSLEKLFGLFEDVLSRREMKTDRIRAGFNAIKKDLFTIEEKTDYIMNLLFIRKKINFTAVFAQCHGKAEKVITFLALLELIKGKKITVRQENTFSDIHIEPRKDTE